MGIANAERKYCAKTIEFEALNLFSPCESSKQRGNITRALTKLILSSQQMKRTQEVEDAGMLALGKQPLPQTYEETERHILRKKRDHLIIEGFHQFELLQVAGILVAYQTQKWGIQSKRPIATLRSPLSLGWLQELHKFQTLKRKGR